MSEVNEMKAAQSFADALHEGRIAELEAELESLRNPWMSVEVGDLDRVDVMFEDHSPGKGWVTIRCFGEAWANFWPAIGDQTIMEFFWRASDDYLANKLSSVPSRVIDYDRIGRETGIGGDAAVETLMCYGKELRDTYGDDWMMDLPEKPNPDFDHLRRIIRAIQASLPAPIPDNRAPQTKVDPYLNTCEHPKTEKHNYHDSSVICRRCNSVVEQFGKTIDNPPRLDGLPHGKFDYSIPDNHKKKI